MGKDNEEKRYLHQIYAFRKTPQHPIQTSRLISYWSAARSDLKQTCCLTPGSCSASFVVVAAVVSPGD